MMPNGRWPDGIAIVGMACRFPGARNVEEFWSRIARGDRLIRSFTEAELRQAGVPDALLNDPNYVRAGTVLEDADQFDAAFFGYSRREAEIMDPQQRVFLECCWEALEDAGYAGQGGRAGVYAGVGMNTYLPLQLLPNPSVVNSAGGYQLMLGNDKDYLASRVAYKLNLRGPAVGIQTACSTSLAAVHVACIALLNGECEMALAGGVAIPFPQTGYRYVPGMILSPDGYCRPFDAAARGTVPGRGAGVVVLKPLSRALADGDTITAVIRGSAWNNDGGLKVGYTAPSVDGQAEVIIRAQESAALDPRQFSYLEAHGTATELGDPIEVAALTQAFRRATSGRGFCALGSVKANLGHADTAAGVAGLIKCALALRHGIVPPSPYFTSPNPRLDLDTSPFYVNRTPESLPTGERYAGVSSFGIGGTNVHACLSAPPEPIRRGGGARKYAVLPLSARTDRALAQSSSNLAAHLETHSGLDLQAAACTLQLGRHTFAWRRAVVAANAKEGIAALSRTASPSAPVERAREVVFLFPGQGEQYGGMGRGLCATDAAFRAILQHGAERLHHEFGIDVTAANALGDTSVSQPALFLLEYALAQRWQSLGIKPSALLGHSLGELTAAAVAGVFSFDDALRLAAIRGRLMQSAPEGAMLAVGLPPEQLREYLHEQLWIAAENAPRVTVAAGTTDAIDALTTRLASARISAVRLPARQAFHTPLMKTAAGEFSREVAAVRRQKPSIPWLSNVTGDWITASEAVDPNYWARQITGAVCFREAAVKALARTNCFLEIGPGQTLLGLMRQHGTRIEAIASLPPERQAGDDERVFAEAAAHLWELGHDIRWQELYGQDEQRRVPLPTYPFERERFWVDAAIAVPTPTSEPAQKRADLSEWFYAPSWRRTGPAGNTAGATPDLTATRWLVLLDTAGLGELLAARLERSGRNVVRVQRSDGFAQSRGGYSIDPLRVDDYRKLMRALAEAGDPPAGLLFCWAMRDTVAAPYDSLVRLLQAAMASRIHFRQVEIVTDHLQQIGAEPIEQPERAEVHGIALVLPTEQRRVRCRVTDVLTGGAGLDATAAQVQQEIESGPRNESVAYRGAYRWVKDWEPAALAPSESSPLRERGGYLITGGMGGIGRTLATYLAREYRARLVLTTRRPGAACADAVREWEQLGAEVAVYSADASDRSAMQAALDDAHRRFGPMNGVIHAAGLGTGAFLTTQDLTATLPVRRPKVAGSLVLAELLQGQRLDFFLLCSSISSVVPAVGLSAYAGANAFLDSFAPWCRERYGLPATSVHFDTWQDVGMAVEAATMAGMEELKEQQLRRGIKPDEGVEVFRRVLRWPQAEILVSTAELPSLLKWSDALRPGGDSRPEAPLPGAEGAVNGIIEIWREVLAADPVGPHDNFFELGGHSLVGTILLTRLRERFGVALTLRMLFDSPTPAGLAVLVSEAQRTPAPVGTGASAEEREEFEI